MSSLLLLAVRNVASTVIAWLFACSLTGCTSLPHLDKQIGRPGVTSEAESHSLRHPPTINDLVLKLQCEIEGYSPPQTALKGSLKKYAYVVTASLSADVKVDGGLSPSLNFINPLSTPNTNFTNAIGGQWDGTQHKNFTQQFSLDLSKEVKGFNVSKVCSAATLGGNFGVDEILNSGLEYGPETKNLMYEMPADMCSKDSKVRPVFGATIDFAILLSATGGPTWTVMHFKGPSGSSPWIDYSRKEMNTLTVSFAPSELGDVRQCQDALKAQKQLHDLESEIESSNQIMKSSQDIIENARSHLVGYSGSQAGRNALISNLQNAELRKSSASDRLAKAQFSKDTINADLAKNQAVEKQDAARAAQENNTQMILQNLLLNTH